MIEYLYNTIRATAGDIMPITAIITDDEGKEITDGCHFMLYSNDDKLIKTVMGDYSNGEWVFQVPTAELDKGKYWYCICLDNEKLCFKQRIYLI